MFRSSKSVEDGLSDFTPRSKSVHRGKQYLSPLGRILLSAALVGGLTIGIHTSASAEEIPTIQLVFPVPGSKLTPDAPFKMTLRVSGGTVSKYLKEFNPCRNLLADNNGGNVLSLNVGAVDANGYVKALVHSGNQNFGAYLFEMTKVLPDAIECTIDLQAETRWVTLAGEPDVLRMNRVINSGGLRLAANDQQYGSAKEIVIGWRWNSDQANIFTRFLVGSPAAPTFTFSGIKTGETLEGPKSFSVLFTIGKSFSPDSTGVTGASCTGAKKISENDESRTYQEECVVRLAWGDPSKNTYSIKYDVGTAQGMLFTSNTIVVNGGEAIKAGKPDLELYNHRYGVAPNSKIGSETSHTWAFNGELRLSEPDRNRDIGPIANQSIKICLGQSCGEVITDKDGRFEYSVENFGIAPTYTFTSLYRGNQISSTNNSFVPYSYSFKIQEKAEPVPVLEFKLGIKVVKSPPSTLKWGKSFAVSIAATGSGGASCEMYFQDLAWPSRKGVTSFRLTAGKTTNIVIRPWARIFALYPVKFACVEDGWPMMNSDRSISPFDKGKRGGTIGKVTIIR